MGVDLPCPQARAGIPIRLNNEVDLVGCSYWIFFFWGIGVFDEAKLIQFDNQKSWCDGTLDPTNKGVKQIEMEKIHPQINHFQPPLFFFSLRSNWRNISSLYLDDSGGSGGGGGGGATLQYFMINFAQL